MRVTGELVTGKEATPILCEWMAQRMGATKISAPMAMGVLRGEEIIVAVAYDDFRWPNVCMHIASKPGALWASPGFLYHIFAYPFLQLNCNRVTATIAKKNKRCRDLVSRLGFRHEGTLKRALKDDDITIYGLLKRDCRWLAWGEERKAA